MLMMMKIFRRTVSSNQMMMSIEQTCKRKKRKEGDARASSPETPPYSPLISPERRDQSGNDVEAVGFEEGNRFPATSPEGRDRSPIRSYQPSEFETTVVIEVLDEDTCVDDVVMDDVFLAPDAHAMYVSPGTGERRQSGRRGARGVVGRGRALGHPQWGRRGQQQWEVGQPLCQIYLTDDDVPPELVSLARDVMRRREMRIRDTAGAESNSQGGNSIEGENVSESENENEFFIASDGTDSLPRLEGQNLQFEWSPMDSFQGQEENFVPERSGSVQFHNLAYDAFRSFWDDDILGHIVAETNSYATKIASAAFQSDWYPTNIDEILCLFSFWMMLAIIRMPTVTSCFSVDPLLKTDIFRTIFTRKRYINLTRALNFVESDPAFNDGNPSNTGAARRLDRVHCLRPIITHLNKKFQSNYVLNKDIYIDESLTLWKGKLNIKQYIRSKAAKFGIKTFELCESITGYVWSFIVYTGKQSTTDLNQSPGVLKSTAVVKKLIGPLLNKGYRLFMGDWYNSPLLARFLKLNGTDCVGTLRVPRKDVPVVINKAPLSRGQIVARHSGDVSVLAWQDKKRITMISTCHDASIALPTVTSRPSSRPVPFKPQMVLDYNKFMGGIDLKDQMLEPYLLERKRCAKWCMKLFKRLINYSIHNSRVLLQSSTHKPHDHLAFSLQLVDSILTHHLSRCPQRRMFNVSSSRSAHHQPLKNTLSAHWPALLSQTDRSLASKQSFRKRCIVCFREGRRSSKTTFCCEACGVPLCIKGCFKSYHTS